ncbi:MAG: hypothetical protein Q7S43_03225 [bacterium]|nr:hypothetical protein [bacterium]MDO8496440.1 hypothetical protein [bacterium]
MAKYPDHDTYRKLYRRFYEGRSTQDLLELAYPIHGMTVLDLCGGDGRLALKAKQYGAKSALLVDEEIDMTVERSEIPIFISSVEDFLRGFQGHKLLFDRILCQQAINYWLNYMTVQFVHGALNENGIFVFNTFHNKPSEKPTTRGYEIEGLHYVEVSWLVDDIVHHVQIREGLPSHTTSFYWLSPDYLAFILKPYFEIEVKKEGATSLYRCLKK